MRFNRLDFFIDLDPYRHQAEANKPHQGVRLLTASRLISLLWIHQDLDVFVSSMEQLHEAIFHNPT